MIVITRNGETTVIDGWREWIVRAVVFLVMLLLLAIVVFLMLGLAVTLGAILMIAIPAVIVVALLGSMFAKH
jgi:type IV secretory pathway TrbL component